MKDCGHCVISGFYLLKEVRNLDFNMSSHFFFPALIQTGLSATFKTVWHFFFPGGIDIRSISSDSLGNKKSTC